MGRSPIDPGRLAARFARLAIAAALDAIDPDGWPDRRRIIGRAVERSINPNARTDITQFLDAVRNGELGRHATDPHEKLTKVFRDLLYPFDRGTLSRAADSIDAMASALPWIDRSQPALRGFMPHLGHSSGSASRRGITHLESARYDAEDIEPAVDALHLSLARLFLRLGPPPEPTGTAFTPASNGGGGAQA
ncbi:hypothetical protein [Streptomyces sp. NBC_00691]|uniref:hypothetical protein n=1 Tax=Streptomyces sp. NBC_00691 TaxID=2903671 RepID=UPI002E325A4B|nr:hypothetical protein [Streptomyces sp. NBC_00691]